MLLRSYPPPPDLAHLIVGFWYFSAPPPRLSAPTPFLLCAQSEAELIFGIKGVPMGDHFSGRPELVLMGPQESFQSHAPPDAVEFVGATLHAEMIEPFFGIPGSLARNARLQGREFLGPTANELIDNMAGETRAEQRVLVLRDFLRARLGDFRVPRFHGAIHRLRQTRGRIPMEEIAHWSGLSRRQFERKFRGCTGFTPGLYSRLLRFTRAMRSPARHGDLTSLAYDLGYCDQSHFIREFKRFSGHNPTILLDAPRVDTLLRV